MSLELESLNNIDKIKDRIIFISIPTFILLLNMFIMFQYAYLYIPVMLLDCIVMIFLFSFSRKEKQIIKKLKSDF